MKRKNSSRTNQPRHVAQCGEGIGEKLENETTHGCIEWLVVRDLVHIGLGEAHIAQARLGHASPSSGDGVGIALYARDFSRRTNQSSHQHCNVSDAGAEIQNTLTWTNACFTEQSFRERSKMRSLPDQAFVLGVCATK
jgi:hypothetical protein